MKITDVLKTDSINKNVLLVITLFSLGLAAWMMASRYETLQQLRTLQVAQDGAQLRIKELTDKLTEKDLEVEKVAKLSAEEAVKKIINLPELDRVLGIKSTTAAVDGSPASLNPSSDLSPLPPSSQLATPGESPPANEPASSTVLNSENKSEDGTSLPVPTSDQTSSIISSAPDAASPVPTATPVSEPDPMSTQTQTPEAAETGASSSTSSEVSNTP